MGQRTEWRYALADQHRYAADCEPLNQTRTQKPLNRHTAIYIRAFHATGLDLAHSLRRLPLVCSAFPRTAEKSRLRLLSTTTRFSPRRWRVRCQLCSKSIVSENPKTRKPENPRKPPKTPENPRKPRGRTSTPTCVRFC